jgi:hypothetical protein
MVQELRVLKVKFQKQNYEEIFAQQVNSELQQGWKLLNCVRESARYYAFLIREV